MAFRPGKTSTETQRKRSALQRMTVVHGVLLLLLLVIVARLIELQVVNGREYFAQAQKQHFGRIDLPARRGDILGVSSKTGERNIFATNTTLDLVYVDPVVVSDPTIERAGPEDAVTVAETLAEILLTTQSHDACSHGLSTCPRELIPFYAPAFDPLSRERLLASNVLLEPLTAAPLPPSLLQLPDFTEAKRLFARDIEARIRQKRVVFSPLKYGATKLQMRAVQAMNVPGLFAEEEESLIYANPEQVPQSSLRSIARALAAVLQGDAAAIEGLLRARNLQYVPVMRRLTPAQSLKIKQAQLRSLKETLAKHRTESRRVSLEALKYPLRSIALIPEHPRFYPDTTVASQVMGFLNNAGDPQYGIERTFNPLLRGRQGSISTVRDPQGGQILTAAQTIEKPQDGDTVVLTLDRTIQKELETLMDEAVRSFKAESGQAIVMEPDTGRILAMVNAPLFDSNNFADVYRKEAIRLDENQQSKVVLELTHPDTNAKIMTGFVRDVFTASGRTLLSERLQRTLADLEKLYDLHDLARYYHYLNETVRREIFPTDRPDTWLKYRNDLGVGAYLNRSVQEVYEPGSVLKPITMAIALDQGEVRPDDIYDDVGPVKIEDPVARKTTLIRNALLTFYGRVTMTNCIEFSINTCMTNVSQRLGKKLFHRSLERFGFGHITGIEFEDEQSGTLKSWREWADIDLASISFGQAISSTPLQVTTAWAALANGGRLLRPTIIDRVIHSDGTEDVTPVKVVDQVITSQTSETITAMLVSSAERGFAKAGKPAGYRVAAKTGTSQIALPSGKGYEDGSGTTIATFAGYAPVDRPRFVILVKLDRPKTTIYGVDAAAPVFKKIAAFLFSYYGIPPDAT